MAGSVIFGLIRLCGVPHIHEVLLSLTSSYPVFLSNDVSQSPKSVL